MTATAEKIEMTAETTATEKVPVVNIDPYLIDNKYDFELFMPNRQKSHAATIRREEARKREEDAKDNYAMVINRLIYFLFVALFDISIIAVMIVSEFPGAKFAGVVLILTVTVSTFYLCHIVNNRILNKRTE